MNNCRNIYKKNLRTCENKSIYFIKDDGMNALSFCYDIRLLL